MYSIVILNFVSLLCCVSSNVKNDDDDGSAEGALITQLRNDANLDLSVDEEYEDLRAELLAYHTALASLSTGDEENNARKSMLTTPCWELNGICVNYKLCTGFRFLTEVPGCKDKLKVCCFTWNRYQVRDMRDKGLGTLALPWQAVQYEFGGEGIISMEEETSWEGETKLKKRRPGKPKQKPRPRPRPKTKKPTSKKPKSNERFSVEVGEDIAVEEKENEHETEVKLKSDEIITT